MSRHRAVRNMNIEEELEIDAISEEEDISISPEEQVQLEDAVDQVREIIGTETVSGISDAFLKDVVWNNYFDVGRSVEEVLEEKERRQIASDRKDLMDDRGLPVPPPGEEDYLGNFYVDPAAIIPQSSGFTRRLSTISERTERTERTEESRPWPSHQELLAAHAPRRPPSTPTTSSYGQVIHPSSSKFGFTSKGPLAEDEHSVLTTSDFGQVIDIERLVDPNDIHPSPSLSALRHLSIRTPSPTPTAMSGQSASTVQPPRPIERYQESEALETPSSFVAPLSFQAGPEAHHPKLSDNSSEVIHNPSQAGPERSHSQRSRPERSQLRSGFSQVSSRGAPEIPGTAPPMSKLASLASSRALSNRSKPRSEASLSYMSTESTATYPNLRPKSLSSGSTSVLNSAVQREVDAAVRAGVALNSDLQKAKVRMSRATKEALPSSYPLPFIPSTPQSGVTKRPAASTPSNSRSTSAPQKTAAQERVATKEEKEDATVQESSATQEGNKTKKDSASREENTEVPEPDPVALNTSPTPNPPMSKLALLAQTKAAERGHTTRRIKKPRVLAPPYATTEYLTPTSSSSSVTTAITTYTQTPDNMVSLSRAKLPPSYPPEGQDTVDTGTRKQSKLALKAKKSHPKPSTEAIENAERTALEYMRSRAQDPIYDGKLGASGAVPSPFASLLVDDLLRTKKSKHKSDATHDKSEERMRRRQRKEALLPMHLLNPAVLKSTVFAFDVPSPDDVVMSARWGTALDATRNGANSSKQHSSDKSNRLSAASLPARELEKAQKAKNKQIEGVRSGPSSATTSRSSSPAPLSPKSKGGSQTGIRGKTAAITPKSSSQKSHLDQQALDIFSLNLEEKDADEPIYEAPPKMTLARDKVLEEARRALDSVKKAVSLVVIGHVDAGKSTLMGRLLYELGLLDERKRLANERESNKMGKGSFTWAWEMDGTLEERSRGVTMDIALQALSTPNRQITILDAPGHRDFIPNMISGATQADCALLVVDAATGEFEAGFDKGGQTREHLVLVRSLGVSQVVVAVNKLDQVKWEKDRYDEIVEVLRPFLAQTGFNASKAQFVPVGALSGINLVVREGQESEALNAWYNGPTLVDLLDKLEPPTRAISAPLRFPISNVFKGMTGGTAVSGRLSSGVVQVGEQLRILPGDESAVVRSIEVDDASVSWASAGSNATLYLTNIDPIHLNIGYVLCTAADIVPLTTSFTARIIVFDVQLPITIGAPVELFHHSHNVPAVLTKFIAMLDRATGAVVKKYPRVLTKGTSAEVQITLRTTSMSGPASRAQPIPLEPFAVNKEMGRLLLRRGGESLAAGIVLDVNAK
ncbi:hypothetical protein M0805_005425 [Coniferiporia weirii]|nr:hypothetical protein M0805_005425 [Coniferiporia weirii]